MNRILVVFLVSAGLASASGCGAAQANEGDQGNGNGGGLSYQEFSFICPDELTHPTNPQEFVVAEDLPQPKGMTAMIQIYPGQWVTLGTFDDGANEGNLRLRFKDGTLALYGDGCSQERRSAYTLGANILLFY